MLGLEWEATAIPSPSVLQASRTSHHEGSVDTALHAFHSIVRVCLLSSAVAAVQVCEHTDSVDKDNI